MYLGIDIGGTSIKFAVIDDNYKIIHYETCKTPDNVTVKITDEMFRIASKIRESYNFSAAGISAAVQLQLLRTILELTSNVILEID